jgi:hypothetical protein
LPFLRSVPKNKGKDWTDFYKFIRIRKGKPEDIVTIRDVNERLITDPIAKANSLNFCYSSVFSCEPSISQIQCANSHRPFAIITNIVRGMLAAIVKNKSVVPDVSGQILKLGGEAMISYFARLLDITVINATIPSDWKKAIVLPIYKGDDLSLVSNYRPVSGYESSDMDKKIPAGP